MNNSLGPEGARHIAGVLKSGNKRLKKINLYWNNIGNEGLEAICGGLASRSNYPRDFVLVGFRYPNLASFQDFLANISKTKTAAAATNTSRPPCQSVRIALPLPPHFLFPPFLKSMCFSRTTLVSPFPSGCSLQRLRPLGPFCKLGNDGGAAEKIKARVRGRARKVSIQGMAPRLTEQDEKRLHRPVGVCMDG
jgi:hypothetical protein